jgi:serine/threonine-protein phosphatase 5
VAVPFLQGNRLYKSCRQLFAALPLAAVVGGACLVLHGGLFRRPPSRVPAPSRPGQPHLPRKRKRVAPMRLGGAPPRLGTLEVSEGASMKG